MSRMDASDGSAGKIVEYNQSAAASAGKAMQDEVWTSTYQLKVAANGTTECANSPLFVDFLETAASQAFDPSSPSEIDKWSQKYACSIKTDEDAINASREISALSPDPYDDAYSAAEVSEIIRMRTERTGIGLIVDQRNSAYFGYITVGKNVPGSPADLGGLKPGDLITSVDGKSIENLTYQQSFDLIFGKKGEQVMLHIKRGSQEIDLPIVRDQVSLPVVTEQLLDGGVAYIKVDNFYSSNGPTELMAALKKNSSANAYVLDLRDNPGGSRVNAYAIASMLMESGEIVEIKQRAGTINGEPTYSTETVSINNQNGRKFLDSFTKPGEQAIEQQYDAFPNLIGKKALVILVNGHTAASAEILTAALKESGGAYVVGTKTDGNGVDQIYIAMPGKTGLRVTNQHHFTPNGVWLGDGSQVSNGILPNLTLGNPPKTSPGSANDKQLNAALAYLKHKVS